MLEQMRRNSRSFIIWILFGIIIAVFIISFGPQASPDSLGCGTSDAAALEVDGAEIPMTSWRFAMSAVGGGGRSRAMMRRQQAVDLLVARELLAQEAEKQGFRVSDEAVNNAIAAGDLFIMGQRMRISDPEYWRNYEMLEGYASNLGVGSVVQLAEEQRREQLAENMRHLLMRSSTVSPEEARQYYINENTKITADYVKFDVRRYRSALHLDEAQIGRFVADHDDEIKKAWETEKTQWSDDRPRVLARLLLIAKDPAAAKPADGAAAPASPAKPAKERAEEARAKIASGADFGTVAREVSDDRVTKARGGLTGWRPVDSLGQGKEVVEATKKLALKQVSDVIETERGFYVVRVEERSDKGLTYEQKKQDLASRLAPDFYARALARHDAEQALAQARGGKPLEELFQRKAPGQGMGGMGGQGLQDLPPEVLEQLEQLKRQGVEVQTVPGGAPEGEPGPGEGLDPGPVDGTDGWIFREGPNVLAQSGGAPPPAKPDSASPAAPAKPQTPPAGAAPAAPAAGDLPSVTVDKPSLESVGPAPRMGDFLAGLGRSEKLVADVFEKLEVGKLAPEVYELGDPATGADAFAIVLLKSRENADLAKFDERRPEIMEQLASTKGFVRMSEWVKKRCEDVSKGGGIKVSRELFDDGEESSQKVGYQPCATLSDGAQFRGRRF